MPTPRLYDSFPALIRLIQQNRTGEDHPRCLYYFHEPFDMELMVQIINEGGLDQEKVPSLINRLCRATEEGRTFWMPPTIGVTSIANRDRFQHFLRLARSINPNIPEWTGTGPFSDAFYNRSAMRRLLRGHVIQANRD